MDGADRRDFFAFLSYRNLLLFHFANVDDDDDYLEQTSPKLPRRCSDILI